MHNAACQTHETIQRRFPWRTVALFGLLTFFAGTLVTFVAMTWSQLGIARAMGMVAVATTFVVQMWRTCRRAVRAWQKEFGGDIEYVARRAREHEAGLRFKSP